MKKPIVYVLRKERDGRIIAVFNRYNNWHSTDRVMCSLEEGFNGISPEYMYNRTRPVTDKEEGKELQAHLSEFRRVQRLGRIYEL